MCYYREDKFSLTLFLTSQWLFNNSGTLLLGDVMARPREEAYSILFPGFASALIGVKVIVAI